MKDAINAEILLFDASGSLLNSTVTDPENKSFIVDEIGRENIGRHDQEVFFTTSEHRYKALIKPLTLPGHGKTFLAILMTMEKTRLLQDSIFQAIGWLTFIGIAAMTILGYLIARTITLPIEELVSVTSRIATGDFTKRAIVETGDEIGGLAECFNSMIDQVQSYEKKLVETEKMSTASQMAAGLAHEIRNPLTSIKMFVQILHGRLNGQPDNQDMADSLLKEICRLERIIAQIVERARPGDLNLIEGNVNEHLLEVLKLAGPTLEAGKITIKTSLDMKIPEFKYDPEKMKQVFWNLFVNSKEAMPKGGHLEISSLSTQDGVRIVFADNGIGLREESSEIYFEPFYSTKPEGLGLGLSTSGKIVRKHGGSLDLINRIRGGVKAVIQLPVEIKQ